MMTDMMGCRYNVLTRSIEPYVQTGVSLLQQYEGRLYPAITADDIGMYCIIPKIVHYFGISLNSAIAYFYNGLLFGSLMLGIVGFMLLFRSWTARAASIIGLLMLTKFVSEPMDVYRIAGTVIMGTVPLLLYFVQRNIKSKWFYPFLLYAGLYSGLAHYVRIHSGTPVAILVLVLILFSKTTALSKRIIIIATFAAGFAGSSAYFMYEWHKHVTYVQEKIPDARVDSGAHVFWHQIYIGFGFIENDKDIRYDDHVADMKVQSIRPNTPYPCSASEAILKNEVIKLMKEDYFFVLRTLGAKLGVIFLLFLLFANFGVIATILYPKDWFVELAFLLSLGFSSIPGILTIPHHMYLLGFVAIATMYGIFSIGYSLEHGIAPYLMTSISSMCKNYVCNRKFWKSLIIDT